MFDHRTDRRRFFSHLAGSTATLTLGASVARTFTASPRSSAGQADAWLAGFTGTHKAVFDVPRWNEGFVLPYARGWVDTVRATFQPAPGDASAMIVLRHFGTPMVLNDAMWEKYPLGELFNVTDPATGEPARRNIYFRSRRGDIPWPTASLDQLQADGVLIVVCALALRVTSARPAQRIGIAPADAHAEWAANLIPGARIAPSGTLATMRAQQLGAAYSFAG